MPCGLQWEALFQTISGNIQIRNSVLEHDPEGYRRSDRHSTFGFRATLRALENHPLQSRAELDDDGGLSAVVSDWRPPGVGAHVDARWL